jgi:hypothetical protein
MNLDTIFGNNMVKKVLFGKLQKWAIEEKVRTIVLPLDHNGNLGEPTFHTEETVTISKTYFTELIKNQKDV